MLVALPVWADETSPVGLWKNIDDVSGKPRALIRITESNGSLLGKIEKASLIRIPTGSFGRRATRWPANRPGLWRGSKLKRTNTSQASKQREVRLIDLLSMSSVHERSPARLACK